MALLDEPKLQGNVYQILDLLRKQNSCCHVVTALWMTSSIEGTVFVTIDQNGGVSVYDAPGGTKFTPAEYGTLTPYTP